MINRIRDVRRAKRMTLADVAARCDPPTTPQTVGRLETGMRNLSLDWMNKIAAALGVEPRLLLRSDTDDSSPKLVARFGESGAEALAKPTDALLAQRARRRSRTAGAGHRYRRRRLPQLATRCGCAGSPLRISPARSTAMSSPRAPPGGSPSGG